MGARHRDGGLEPHQLGEHFGAPHHGNAVLIGGFHLGVGPHDRGGDHHHGGVPQILGGMADRHRNAAVAQALHDVGVRHVRALHLVAEVMHHLGDARHADAADADEVNGTDVGGDALHA